MMLLPIMSLLTLGNFGADTFANQTSYWTDRCNTTTIHCPMYRSAWAGRPMGWAWKLTTLNGPGWTQRLYVVDTETVKEYLPVLADTGCTWWTERQWKSTSQSLLIPAVRGGHRDSERVPPSPCWYRPYVVDTETCLLYTSDAADE